MANLNELSTDEIEQLLKERKKQEKADYETAKKEYEETRDKMVLKLTEKAKQMHQVLAQFKALCMKEMQDFKATADKYGDVRANSKGGYSLRSNDQNSVIVYEHNSKPEYDERADMAEELIKEFLETTVKKKDVKTYKTIVALMSRNAKNDFKPAQIALLLKIEDNYDDERWVRAMQLFKESFQNRTISNSVSFYQKDSEGKDQHINLSFSNL